MPSHRNDTLLRGLLTTTSHASTLQVLDPEEEVALDEFAKLEEKLSKDKANERRRETTMGFSP